MGIFKNLKRYSLRITIIRPSSLESKPLLPQAMEYLESKGFEINLAETPLDPDWPFCAGTVADRTALLNSVLSDESNDAIWCARGGYGACDTLEGIDWSTLKRKRPKFVIGFSDISALHWPIYQKLGWPCIHGPMPATELWGQKNDFRDVDKVLSLLRKKDNSHSFPVNTISPGTLEKTTLLGGCLSVITGLIGTQYLESPEEPFAFFFEDTGENPARLMRMLFQCAASGFLDNCSGLIVGDTRSIGHTNGRSIFLNELTKRFNMPIWETSAFGHIHPNAPILLGAQATINKTELKWTAKAETISPNT